MPNLKLDPELEKDLIAHLEHEIQLGRFVPSEGKLFVVDASSSIPGRAPLFSALKEKLDGVIDFQNGGLKVLDFKYRGADARFTVVPGWQASPADLHGKAHFGGPTISLKFTVRW
jgi:hypothetical protein